jgi:methylenetetrahydrofolate dehydrogenase (NADP+)/methenyltetrahydrofolate cyclohydrolase
MDGKVLSTKLRKTLKEQIQRSNLKRAPKLVAIIVGDDPASKIYVANKFKACEAVGISSTILDKPASLSEQALINLITELNTDPNVDGILVQLPLPDHINPDAIIDCIHPNKDVDGFHPYNVGRLVLRKPTMRSCTPYGIMQLLEAYELQARGKNAVLIGVSNIVGRPLALELLLAGATTTSCHRHTKNIEQYVRTADIVVSATGKRDVFDQSSIPPHAVVIDVGIHRINNKVCGDLDFDYLNNRVAYLTPVPGGVGPMTITALLQNTLDAAIKNEHTHQ